MIYTHQVLKGYQTILGNFLLHLSLGFATLICVDVPTGLGTKDGADLKYLYKLQLFVHFVSAAITFLELWI